MLTVTRLLASACALAMTLVLFGCSQGSASNSATASASASSAVSAESASASASSASASASADSAESATASASTASALPNGEYTVSVDTDSTMFHINEADEGKGTLTVTDDGMTVHIRLASKKITELYAGTVEQAKADPDNIIEPTTDTVTYSDGQKEEVFGFDVPVPALDEPFEVAILGSKGNWYDHKVTVSDPVSK